MSTVLTGECLHGATYTHPLRPTDDVTLPLLAGNHVTDDKGTGLVHTAPAHGVDDFQLALQHEISLDCYVDEAGLYMDGVDSRLTGKHVLNEGNDLGSL